MDEKFWRTYYLQQAQQTGHGAAFAGMPYQRGGGLGSIFRGLFRAILPVAKSVGRAVGKQALRTGAAVASDMADGANFKESIKKHGREGVKSFMKTVTQGGGKLGQAPKKRQAKTIKAPRKRGSTSNVGKQPAAKKINYGVLQ